MFILCLFWLCLLLPVSRLEWYASGQSVDWSIVYTHIYSYTRTEYIFSLFARYRFLPAHYVLFCLGPLARIAACLGVSLHSDVMNRSNVFDEHYPMGCSTLFWLTSHLPMPGWGPCSFTDVLLYYVFSLV